MCCWLGNTKKEFVFGTNARGQSVCWNNVRVGERSEQCSEQGQNGGLVIIGSRDTGPFFLTLCNFGIAIHLFMKCNFLKGVVRSEIKLFWEYFTTAVSTFFFFLFFFFQQEKRREIKKIIVFPYCSFRTYNFTCQGLWRNCLYRRLDVKAYLSDLASKGVF